MARARRRDRLRAAMSQDSSAQLESLVTALTRQFQAQGLTTERFDTHISTVLLAGSHAYKFKKPVDFGFLDFSTLERRRHFCMRELTLNLRHAPGLYEDVVPITPGPTLGGDGPAIEYALRMRRFASDARLDVALARGQVRADDLTDIARTLAAAHAQAAGAPPLGSFGTPTLIHHQLFAGLDVLADVMPRLDDLRSALERAHRERIAAFETRLQGGHVRDCHGDLHLTNLVRHGGRWQAFDCIEFDDELRYIDTASDLAFLLMDFDVRAHTVYANQLLNDYLDTSSDYGALSVLDFYLPYRSVVRAKVARLSADGSGSTTDHDARRRARRHLELVSRYLAPRPSPALYLTHGVSGSGKSWIAARIAGARGFIHLRSDIVRKRLAGLAPDAQSGSATGGGIYGEAQTAATYERLAHLAALVLAQGYSVIVDASCLRAAQRAPFEAIARAQGVRYTLIDCTAPREVLEARIETRRAVGRDPSEATVAVLARQLDGREPLSTHERRMAIAIRDLEDEAEVRNLPGGGRLCAATGPGAVRVTQ